MLKHLLIHPKINEILGRAGHHATILIADGHFPVSTKKGPNAEVISLNLMPGVITCAQALEAVVSAVPIEAVSTMMYAKTGPYALDGDPPVWNEFRSILRKGGLALELSHIEMWAFYDTVATVDHVLTIQTADMQRYSNILLSIGVRME